MVKNHTSRQGVMLLCFAAALSLGILAGCSSKKSGPRSYEFTQISRGSL